MGLRFQVAPELNFVCFLKDFYVFILREWEREGERVGEKHGSTDSPMACPGTKPTTQACALTGNRTGDLSLCGTMPTN